MTRAAQSALFLSATAALVLLVSAISPGPVAQVLVLAPAVLLLGVPHGTFDLPIAQRIWPLDGIRAMAGFGLLYLSAAGLVVGFWWLAPLSALTLFLGYSMVHFSGDWAGEDWLWRLGGGLATIGASALFHPDAVARIFALLTGGGEVGPIVLVARICGLAALLLSTAAFLRTRRARPAAELLTLFAGASLLPPLIYFVAYFCFLHSPRHLAEAWTEIGPVPNARASAALTMGATLLMTGAAVFWLDGRALETEILQIVFIGLAALTVPHMILVERWTAIRSLARSA